MLLIPLNVYAINLQVTFIYNNGGKIIVDDEGDGDYRSIKEALNNADSGDTIEVYSGTYYENDLSIYTESITLKGIPKELGDGNDSGKPFINGQGNSVIITIEANKVVVEGFRMENSLDGGYNTLINIGIDANQCMISENDLANVSTNSDGISIGGNRNRIINNKLRNCDIIFGVPGPLGPSGNIIYGNTVSNAEYYGIWVKYSRNIIAKNKITSCGLAGIGSYGSFNLFMYNTMENNSIGFEQSSDFPNYVTRNNFIDNGVEVSLYISLLIPAITMRTNRFSNNYWGEPRSSPYPIVGKYPLYDRTFYDWFPAQKPYVFE
jgi:parallel beta-helix repeat protein